MINNIILYYITLNKGEMMDEKNRIQAANNTMSIDLELSADDQICAGGYTRAELKNAFEKVQNRENWKMPIDAIINKTELEVVLFAITFYTGSVARIVYSAGKKLKIKARGYYLDCN